MIMKDRPLIIVGDSAFAQIAYHYFTENSNYKVVAFSVEQEFVKNKELFSLPVVAFETLANIFSPAEHSIFVAITYGQLNRVRSRLVLAAKNLGYSLASYISPGACISKHALLGEHHFVFENNVVQPFSRIGDNVILWSGNHIGHHSTIDSHCFISSHVVISGYVSVGKYCFFGVNSTISNNLSIGDDVWIGPATLITQDIPSGSLLRSSASVPSAVNTHDFFKVKEEVGV
jgi:sugar O-acyltransferase (sialic acid O-acetyltransferase NeuD family)